MPLSIEDWTTAPSKICSHSQKTLSWMTGPERVAKLKLGPSTQDCSLLLYTPLSPPLTQQFTPLAALLITALAGVPKAQELAVPPLVQAPGPDSKSWM